MKLNSMYQLKIRRKLAAFLAAAMVMTSFSVPAYAAEVSEEAVTESEQVMIEGTDEAIVEEAVTESEQVNVEGINEEAVTSASSNDVPTGNLPADTTPAGAVSGSTQAAQKSIEEIELEKLYASISANDVEILKSITAPITYDSTQKLCSSEMIGNSGKVKIKWKANGGKYAKVYAIISPGNGTGLVQKFKNNYDPEGKIKGKSFVDNHPNQYGSVYLVAVFDAAGSNVMTYITVPTTYIASVRTEEDDIKVTFAGLLNGVEYTIYRAIGSNRGSYEEIGTISANALEKTSVADRLAYVYTDKGCGTLKNPTVNDNKKLKYYYKVKTSAKVKIKDFNGVVEGKLCKNRGVKGVSYQSPIISCVTGTAEHPDGCKSEIVLWFQRPKTDLSKSQVYTSEYKTSDCVYEVYRTEGGYTLTLIGKVKGSALKTWDKEPNLLGISLTGVQPDSKSSYVIRMVYKNKWWSEYSNPYDYSFHFQDVATVSYNNIGAKKVRLTWDTELCASKYAVYKTIRSDFDSVSAANGAVKQMKYELSGYNKKVGTKTLKHLSNGGLKYVTMVQNTFATGDEIEAFVGGLTSGGNYGILVVPMDQYYGYDDAATAGIHVQIGSPASLKYTSKGSKYFKLTWSKVQKASGYKIERITVSDVNGFEDLTGLESFKDYEIPGAIRGSYLISDTISQSTKTLQVMPGTGSDINSAKEGTIYLYRVRSVLSDGSLADPTPEKIVYGVIGPKAVKDLKTTILKTTSDSNYYWENKSTKNYYTMKGELVTKRGVKISFTKADKNATYKVYKKVSVSSLNGVVSASDGFEYLGEMTQGTGKDGKTFKKSGPVNIYDGELTRGVKYTYKIVPVLNGIDGCPQYADFCVASGWKIYAKINSNYNNVNCSAKSSGVAMPVVAGKVYRMYIEWNEPDVTVTDFKSNSDDDDDIKVVAKGEEEYYSNGRKYTRSYVDIAVSDKSDGGDNQKIKFTYSAQRDDRDTIAVSKNNGDKSVHNVEPLEMYFRVK